MQPDFSSGVSCLSPQLGRAPQSLLIVLLAPTLVCPLIRLSVPQAGSKKRVLNPLFPRPGQGVGPWRVDNKCYWVTVRCDWPWVAGSVLPRKGGSHWSWREQPPGKRDLTLTSPHSSDSPPPHRHLPICLAHVFVSHPTRIQSCRFRGRIVFLFDLTCSISWLGCCDDAPHTGWLTTDIHSSAWRPEVQDQSASRAGSSWGLCPGVVDGHLLPVFPCVSGSQCLFFYKDPNPIGLALTLMASFNLLILPSNAVTFWGSKG